uniref:Uncharacterized protein n=1 Tax=viral metagenome TaxID=1070528 RepID=A0A6H1ZJU3_9ZZZZ
MGNAYKCDWCEDYKDEKGESQVLTFNRVVKSQSRPLQVRVVASITGEFCPACKDAISIQVDNALNRLPTTFA